MRNPTVRVKALPQGRESEGGKTLEKIEAYIPGARKRKRVFGSILEYDSNDVKGVVYLAVARCIDKEVKFLKPQSIPHTNPSA